MDALHPFVSAISGFKFSGDRCLYCDSPDERVEADHFPIPSALGGIETVRACVHCHNVKDRLSESMAFAYFASRSHECEGIVFAPGEVEFILGIASLLPLPASNLIDDLRDFPPAVRIMIGRRVREQLQAMMAAAHQ